MSSKTTTFFIVLCAALAIGCKKSDDAAANTDTSKPATTASTDASKAGGDTTKPADDSTPKDTASANSVVGTWTVDEKGMANEEVEFKEDGTATRKADIEGQKIHIEMAATYKVDGDKMTITPTSAKASADADATADAKKMVDEMNKEAASPDFTKKNGPMTETMKWQDKDNFSTTDDKGKATNFKRKA